MVPSGSSVLQSGLDYRLASTTSPAFKQGWDERYSLGCDLRFSHYLLAAGLGDLASEGSGEAWGETTGLGEWKGQVEGMLVTGRRRREG